MREKESTVVSGALIGFSLNFACNLNFLCFFANYKSTTNASDIIFFCDSSHVIDKTLFGHNAMSPPNFYYWFFRIRQINASRTFIRMACSSGDPLWAGPIFLGFILDLVVTKGPKIIWVKIWACLRD